MKIEGTYTLHLPRETVYKELLNPEVLAAAMPGCEKLTPNPDGSFSTEMKIGLAFAKGRYRGRIQVLDAIPPEHYRLSVEARGTGGFVKGDGTLALSEDSGSTVIRYSGDVEVGGPVASVAQRLMGGAARQMAQQFFEAFATKIQPPPPTAVTSL